MRSVRWLPVLLLVASSVFAQDRAAEQRTAFARAQHLRHGINASEWFAQHAYDYSAAFTNHYTDDGDIALMAKLGFDNVRLSIDPVPLEQGLNHEGQYADFVARLDHVVDKMLGEGLAVQVDIHPESPYKAQVRETSEGVDRFVMLWRRLAAHYADRNPDLMFFEIMNEPEETDPYRWEGIQARAAVAIREVAPKNTIIATGPSWSGIGDLVTQHPLADGNVIYTFHFYQPEDFTHQGASWGTDWHIYSHGITYPSDESQMADGLKQVPDARDRYNFEHYWLDHWDAHRMRLLMDSAAVWGKVNGVPLICNEFGVYRKVAPEASRMQWIHDVRTALEADGIGWTMWDYRGGFGVVWKEDGQPARVDEKVVAALGLKGK